MVTKERKPFSTYERGRIEELIAESESEDDLDSVEVIKETSDLPSPENGVHPLDPMTAYKFDGYVMSDYGLELGFNTPLLAPHGASGGFIHTGGQTCINGTDQSFFARDVFLHAPGGTIFDISGTTQQEILAESVTISDQAGMGNIADLGTIDGFRVPSFKGCNFENFDSGLTFTGTSDKVFIESSPFRGVTADNVVILDFDENFECGLVDIVNSYVKGVQPDTEVVNVSPNSTINDQFQYRGNVHDETVVRENIFNGGAAFDESPFNITDSYPLPDTPINAGYSLDTASTITISTQATDKTDGAAYSQITDPVTVTDDARFTVTTGGTTTYDGKRSLNIRVDAFVTAGTGNDETLSAAFFRNGSIVNSTATRFESRSLPGNNALSGNTLAKGVLQSVSQGDEIDLRFANLDATTDINVGELSVTISKI